MENKEIIENSKKESGQFKPKRRFISFISGTSNKIRYNRDIAFIDAKYLSSTLEGVKFKITIYKDGTIDFDEVDTKKTDIEMRSRLIEAIDDRDVTGYTMKYIVEGLLFKDEFDKTCYLEIEQKKPIQILADIFDSIEEEPKKEVYISKNGIDFLDSLLEEINNTYKSDKELDNNINIVNKENTEEKIVTNNIYADMFEKMNQDKINEIKERIEKTSKEINNIKSNIKNDEERLEKLIENINLLEKRLDSFNVSPTPNGFVFFISEKENKGQDLNLTEENREMVDKIADIIGLKKDVLFRMLTESYFSIKIANKDDFESKENITKDILNMIKSLVDNDSKSKIKIISPFEYHYSGSLTWHQLVDKMIRMGFEQNEDFNRINGSNSYKSNEDDPKQNQF